jgi:hypothetical protein
MFEAGCHNVNGVQWDGLPADSLERVLHAGGWCIDHLGVSTYVADFTPEMMEQLAKLSLMTDAAERMKRTQDRLKVIAPLLENHRIHMPVWAVVATRVD